MKSASTSGKTPRAGKEAEAELQKLTAELKEIKEFNEKIRSKNPWSLKKGEEIKKAYAADPETARKKYPEVFYYFDGMINTTVSRSIHPAGIVASPITLKDNYGCFRSDDKTVLQIDMESVHELSLVKYDILGLKNIGIIRDSYKLINKPYPSSNEIDWQDAAAWEDMTKSPVGLFQFESDFAHKYLRRFKPRNIKELCLLTAALRPSGASYRDGLADRIPNKNPSKLIDDLLKENNSYLVFQEDVIKFLQQICGLSGSEADNVRRAIGRKQADRLEAALPRILDGYVEKSPKPRNAAVKEAESFLKVIEDASDYMFGYNHSVAYCMISYLCAYLRRYYPYEFVTSFLNNARGEDDVRNGSDLAAAYGIKITPPRFGVSRDKYFYDKDKQTIAKGLSSIKYLSAAAAKQLYDAYEKTADTKRFTDILALLNAETTLNLRQRDILIKIDYFSEYGNSRELLEIADMFALFKEGAAKRLAKSKIPQDFYSAVKDASGDKTKGGGVSDYFTIIDIKKALRECEDVIKNKKLSGFSLREKIDFYAEYMGTFDLTTGKAGDRRKLYVTDVFPLQKNGEKPWGYALQTCSVGTGKSAKLTVRAALYKRKPVKEKDIVMALALKKNDAGFWYLNDYDYV